MDDQNLAPTTAQAAEPARRRRKLLALGAGGLVLGIGAVVTMAAWTDTEVATGDFAAGSFGLQSSADGADFADHDTSAEALTISFGDLAQNLSPTDSATAVYAVRLDPASTYGADVTGVVEASGAAADNLTYTVQQVDDIDGSTAQGTLVSSESVQATGSHDLFTLDALSDVVYLKVTVTADEDLAQGETATVLWTLTGESTTSL
ncbi:SipW-dependent-type signal peptide-containing protein [Isoptericola sp. NPDC019693]|uniref:SipW-dependent-type signal peptide-containing protein n=1 Tax=Isoptericola sp. NPDC019693 TaxID=3364009 RepID=UPI00378BE4DE